LSLVREVELNGPWFEHLLGLKPWDLERMSTYDVALRLAWVKRAKEQLQSAGGGGDDD